MKEQVSNPNIGLQIKELRSKLGMTIDALSDRANIDPQIIEELELGSVKIEADKLFAISEALFAKLIFELKPTKPAQQILEEQARLKAIEIVRYVQGTMSLEGQQPSREYLDQLIESQTNKLLTTHKDLIWE